ncbi:MAG: glutamate--tRNA ligase [Clostridiales Family XIII bacterium]|nr:glutamate--tRNA ligase [Clostridiales Family XIII bacterium]
MENNAYFAAIADLFFPEIQDGADGVDAAGTAGMANAAADYEAKYPARALPDGAMVTRLGPSPTGFIHLGNLFMATVNQKLARQSGGVFLLRVEDTDQKREVEGAVESLIRSLAYFGIGFDEGVALGADGGGAAGGGAGAASAKTAERGAYGPYFQSERRAIYRAFAHRLVREGKAYPCFLTEDEIAAIRAGQEASKLLTGVYGPYAAWRGADLEAIASKLAAGEPYVIRLNAGFEDSGEGGTGGAADETITVTDGIRGDITLPKNIMDVVILKKDGLPTYHFAHAIDDHLMHTTHVIRGEEWLPSLPVHIALFRALGFAPPIYCHTALLMKMDGGVKRKLSKRTDPELALSYYIADGYHPLAVREYLLTIINSNYEEWRLSNPELDSANFLMTTEKMGASGILFDLDKLQNVSRDTLARLPAAELADFLICWAAREKPDALPVLRENRATLEAALDIGRAGEKPRKDLAYAAQIFGFISYFFDGYFRMEDPLPENVSPEDARALLAAYLAGYCHTDGRELWFEKIRGLAAAHGYAPRPKDFKNSPDMYKGHVGDVSTVIRRALTGRQNSPDIYEIQQILGEERVRTRIERLLL